MNAFTFRDHVVQSYERFSRSFVRIAAPDIEKVVNDEYSRGRYWPEPLIQINPNYKPGNTVAELAAEGVLHPLTAEIFKVGKDGGNPLSVRLYKHQQDALALAKAGRSFVVTTGTGSGKSLSFFIPIVDHILRAKASDPAPRTRAIIIYPMNALANSQAEEIGKFLQGVDGGSGGLTIARYTGQESQTERQRLAANPPDILLTNFMMLELILTRYEEVDRKVVDHCQGLEFLVMDELHTYRGRQGADVALLVRRLRQRLKATHLLCIGTSATMLSTGSPEDQKRTVAAVASKLFGAAVESIKTLAFDLAAVVHSLEGNCDHPRFLIHDGPREADMARVIYERFFLYARRMENAFDADRAMFQYILTTTTHPPSDMQEGSTWLLGEKLSGKTKEGRLLKEDF